MENIYGKHFKINLDLPVPQSRRITFHPIAVAVSLNQIVLDKDVISCLDMKWLQPLQPLSLIHIFLSNHYSVVFFFCLFFFFFLIQKIPWVCYLFRFCCILHSFFTTFFTFSPLLSHVPPLTQLKMLQLKILVLFILLEVQLYKTLLILQTKDG